MRQILCLKTGSTYRSLARQKGDFEDWITNRLQPMGSPIVTIDVRRRYAAPDLDEIAGVIITGSHHNVTEHLPWMEHLAGWLKRIVEREIPLLGICFGHQILAYAFGGQVGPNPKGLEFGSIQLEVFPDMRKDALFSGLPFPQFALTCHTQSVLARPGSFIHLASSARDQNQAYRIGARAWGVQFHPEFDPSSVCFYIQRYQKKLIAEGQNPEMLQAGIYADHIGPQLLSAFAAICSDDR